MMGTPPPMASPFRPNSFDHVALWVDARDAIAEFAYANLGMHEIERTDTFTLIGVDAKEGKLTLFDAEGPREAGALEAIVLRVSDLRNALDLLPDEFRVERSEGVAHVALPEGLRIGIAEAEGLDYDLDHVVLRVDDPERTGAELADLGFARGDGRLVVADREVRLRPGGAGATNRPLLNHLALLVDSADEVRAEAERRELEIDKVVNAENTLAVFVRGPDGLLVEYVEHKPGFSLV
jgi:catechol 2,3-dioxygenase-like lactoylglutathione lyase family enzyme